MYKEFLRSTMIKAIISTLEREESVNAKEIPFMIAPLAQECAILNDINRDMNRHDFNVYFSKNSDDFRLGYVDIYLFFKDKLDYVTTKVPYFYRVGFDYIEDYCGYCQCTPEMHGYREDKECCGEECDWDIPCAHVQKICDTRRQFNGLQRTYWEFEDSYKEMCDENDARKHQMKELYDKIAEMQKQLEELRRCD